MKSKILALTCCIITFSLTAMNGNTQSSRAPGSMKTVVIEQQDDPMGDGPYCYETDIDHYVRSFGRSVNTKICNLVKATTIGLMQSFMENSVDESRQGQNRDLDEGIEDTQNTILRFCCWKKRRN